MVHADGRLLVFSPMDTVALDANTGDVIWYLDDVAASGSTRPMSHAVAHGRVYLIPSGGDNRFGYQPGVIALDAATGKQLWYAFDDESSSAQSIALWVIVDCWSSRWTTMPVGCTLYTL